MRFIRTTLLVLVVMITFLTIPVFTFAQEASTEPSIADQLQCFNDGNCTVDQFFLLLNAIIGWGARISGALALLLYIIGGIWMLFSAGNSSRVEQGKNIITGTTVALIFILGSWLIVDFTTRALVGETGPDLVDTTTCSEPGSDNRACELTPGSNGICYQGSCLAPCAFYAAYNSQPYQCVPSLLCDRSAEVYENLCEDDTTSCCIMQLIGPL